MYRDWAALSNLGGASQAEFEADVRGAFTPEDLKEVGIEWPDPRQ